MQTFFYKFAHTTNIMKINLKNPSTLELDELSKIYDFIRESGWTFVVDFEHEGHIFCNGSVSTKINKVYSRVFMPVGNDIGKARVLAEILCLTKCLEQLGISFEWMEDDVVVPVSPAAYDLSEQFILGSSSVNEAIRRVRMSGYPNMAALEGYLASFKDSSGARKRATKKDVATFVFSRATEVKKQEVKREGKPIRSGTEWASVKKLAQSLSKLPTGYKSADEFANFASKLEVDEVIQLQDNHDN